MTFLNPLALFGLLAAGIPLALHLFQFYRPQKVEFSSLSFIQSLEQTSLRRLRIRRWLILALRMLAITFLVLAFARPTLTTETTGGPIYNPSAVGLIVDNSRSMTLRTSEGSSLQQSREAAVKLVNQLHPETSIFLGRTAFTDSIQQVTGPYESRQDAITAIENISIQSSAQTLTAATRSVRSALDRQPPLNRSLFLLSDLQASTLSDTIQSQPFAHASLYLIPTQTGNRTNIAVQEVRLQSQIREVGQPITMEVTLQNFGHERLSDYLVSAFLQDERVAQTTVDLKPRSVATASFTFTPQRQGWLPGRISIEEDAFIYDDQRFFVLHVPRQRTILRVRGEGQNTTFVDLLLSDSLSQGRTPTETDQISETQLAAANLGDYDAVFLVGIRNLSSGEIQALSNYVRLGGGLILFPSQAATAADYNALFEELGGGTFTGFVGSLSGTRTPATTVETADLEHPLFSSIFSSSNPRRDKHVERIPVYFTSQYVPGDGAEQTLLQMSNGYPFLQEIQHGSGQVLVFSVAPVPSWSELPRRGLFIPLLYRSISYLASGGQNHRTAYHLGETLNVTARPEAGSEPIRLVSEMLGEVIPRQRMVPGNTQITLDPTTLTEGIYEVRQRDTLLQRLAVNRDTRESDLTTLQADEAAAQLESNFQRPVQVLNNVKIEAARAGLTGIDGFPFPLWTVCLFLTAACLAGELIATGWK